MRELKIDEDTMSAVRDGVAMKKAALRFNLKHYRQRTDAFESKHAMSSEVFLENFSTGNLGDDADWFEWQYLLDVVKATSTQLEKQDKGRL